MSAPNMDKSTELQRKYYEDTAAGYDDTHAEREHVVALHVLAAFIEMNGITSVLDVGAGTGRAMRFLKKRFPRLRIQGIEPVEALRKRGHAQGIPEDDLVAGDGSSLPFADASFDLVCEFAVLHHVRNPSKVVEEMNRVATKMIAISDCNFMGQGSRLLRMIKLTIWSAGLWHFADWIKTRGKRYTYSQGDGIAFSYSVFQDLGRIRRAWSDVQVHATSPNAGTRFGPLVSAGHVLLIAQHKRTTARGVAS